MFSFLLPILPIITSFGSLLFSYQVYNQYKHLPELDTYIRLTSSTNFLYGLFNGIISSYYLNNLNKLGSTSRQVFERNIFNIGLQVLVLGLILTCVLYWEEITTIQNISLIFIFFLGCIFALLVELRRVYGIYNKKTFKVNALVSTLPYVNIFVIWICGQISYSIINVCLGYFAANLVVYILLNENHPKTIVSQYRQNKNKDNLIILTPLILANIIYVIFPMVDSYFSNRMPIGDLTNTYYCLKLVNSIGVILIFVSMNKDYNEVSAAFNRNEKFLYYKLLFKSKLFLLGMTIPVFWYSELLAELINFYFFQLESSFTLVIRNYLYGMIGMVYLQYESKIFIIEDKPRSTFYFGLIGSLTYICLHLAFKEKLDSLQCSKNYCIAWLICGVFILVANKRYLHEFKCSDHRKIIIYTIMQLFISYLAFELMINKISGLNLKCICGTIFHTLQFASYSYFWNQVKYD